MWYSLNILGSLLVMIVGEVTQISASINTATLSEMVF
jgi:hypothetical protein